LGHPVYLIFHNIRWNQVELLTICNWQREAQLPRR